MEVRYEWDAETFDVETNDILSHNHCDTAAQMVAAFRLSPHDTQMVLVRDAFYADGDMRRSWAYVVNNRALGTHFFNPYDHADAKVPQRFHKELRAALSRKEI